MKRTLLFINICLLCLQGFAQKFSFTDGAGCSCRFQVISKERCEASLLTAANRGHADMAIPGNVTYKDIDYRVVKVETEALRKCDASLRRLSFPSTVTEIAGYLFGSATKLSGGLKGVLMTKVGGNTPLAYVKLESLRIPASVQEIGVAAFVTSVSFGGNTLLQAHIDELPTMIVPTSAESFGLNPESVRDYWTRTDLSQLSLVSGAAASLQEAEGMIRQMSPRQKKAALQMLQSNNVYAQMMIDQYAKMGLSKADVVALLMGQELKDETVIAQQSVQPKVPVLPTAPKPADIIISDVDENIPRMAAGNDKTFAVIIANENYQEEVPVEYAQHDGSIFREYCQKVLGLPEENIHFRSDATLNNFRMELDWLTMVSKAYSGEARLIVYYAGHGVPDESSRASYLLPVDGFARNLNTAINLKGFYEQLEQLPVQSIVMFIDACFSGSKRGDGMLASARGVAIKAKPETPAGSMVVFSASQGDETAYPYSDKGHGLFTYFLLKKLKETSGQCSLGELSDYITTEVLRRSSVVNGKTQTPKVTPSQSLAESWRSMKLK